MFRANRQFVDRVEPRAKIREALDHLITEKDHKMLYVFYGVGGIGKTRLLEEISHICGEQEYRDAPIELVSIGMEAYELGNASSILLALRRKIDREMVLFDYALLQYCSKSGLPVHDLMEKFDRRCSRVVQQIMDISIETCGGIVPHLSMLYFARDMFPDIGKLFEDRALLDAFERIEELSAQQLYRLLPGYFADYIDRSDRRYVFLFDDYEAMQSQVESCKDLSSGREMIRTLFASISSTVFVISCRDRIWAPDEVPAGMEQYLIDRLSKEDEEQFLRQIPIDDESIIAEIIEISQGLPLYLDLCVEMYAEYQNGDITDLDLSKIDHRILVERYLGHLPRNEIMAVCYMNQFELVDRKWIRFLFDSVHLTIDDYVLERLLQRSIFEQVGEDLYALDKTLRSHDMVHGVLPETAEAEIVSILLRYLEKLEADKQFTAFRRYFQDACRILHDEAILLEGQDGETFMDAVHFAVDFGLWDYLEEIAERYLSEETGPYRPVYLYIRCQVLKRQGHLREALALCSELLPLADRFGNYEYCCTLLEIQIRHLLGEYGYAIQGYQDVIEDMDLFGLADKDRRTYALCKLKYCDQLMLRGQFATALEYLDTIDIANVPSPDAETELFRIKGHIYRFDLDQRRASRLYAFALKKCVSDCKSKGSLLNNMAEITCIQSPQEALDYGEKSLQLNGGIGAKIECGKTLCATAIAHAFTGDTYAAHADLEKATAIQTDTGYRAGILFVEFARFLVTMRLEGAEEARAHVLPNIRSLCEEVGVYGFLLEMAEWLCGERTAPSGTYQWLDEKALAAGLERWRDEM